MVGRWLARRWFCGVQREYIGDVSRLRASMDSGEYPVEKFALWIKSGTRALNHIKKALGTYS